MRICENGIYRDATPEEITEMERMAANAVLSDALTAEERIAELEDAVIELAALIGGEWNG